MLVLSRRPNERVMIGDDIIVTIADVQGDKVKLGFEAPEDVVIDREEIFLNKRKSYDTTEEDKHDC